VVLAASGCVPRAMSPSSPPDDSSSSIAVGDRCCGAARRSHDASRAARGRACGSSLFAELPRARRPREFVLTKGESNADASASLHDGGGRFMTEGARAGGPRGRSGARRARARRSRAAAPRRGCRSLSAARAAAPPPAARDSGRRTPAAARRRSRAASCALPRCANRYLRLGYRNRQQERLFRLERRVLLRPRLLPARRAPR
jgi:hypothetical protein